MAYGKTLSILNPCPPDDIYTLIPSESQMVLDLGCGRGDTLSFLSKHKQFKLYGIDINPLSQSNPPFSFIQSRAESTPYLNEYFDVAIMECTFSLCDAEKTVSEISRILKPAGILIISDLYTNSDTVHLQNDLLKTIYNIAGFENLFQQSNFKCIYFSDRSRELQAMYLQSIFTSTLNCINVDTKRILKKQGVQYGLWVWKKL